MDKPLTTTSDRHVPMNSVFKQARIRKLYSITFQDSAVRAGTPCVWSDSAWAESEEDAVMIILRRMAWKCGVKSLEDQTSFAVNATCRSRVVEVGFASGAFMDGLRNLFLGDRFKMGKEEQRSFDEVVRLIERQRVAGL